MQDEGKRLIVELASVYIACDDCGHSRVLKLSNLRQAASLGVHTYRDLCRKIRCSECPPRPPIARNLTIRPTWREEPVSLNERLKHDLMDGENLVSIKGELVRLPFVRV